MANLGRHGCSSWQGIRAAVDGRTPLSLACSSGLQVLAEFPLWIIRWSKHQQERHEGPFLFSRISLSSLGETEGYVASHHTGTVDDIRYSCKGQSRRQFT